MLGLCAFCKGPLVSTRAVTHFGVAWSDYWKVLAAAPELPTPALFCDEACRVAGQHWLEEKVNA